jgi:ribosomal protein S18 acetylase RimI-like enzyme
VRSGVPSSLVWATSIDVLPPGRVAERRHDYLVVRSPSNPAHYWGNLLVFDDPPVAGDAARWQEVFDRELGGESRVRHHTFAWDRTDGELGCAREEFVQAGYELEKSVGLVARLDQLSNHPRENSDVVVRALDPAPGADAALWDAVVELEVADREPGHDEAVYRDFARTRHADRRIHFRAGRGAWYVAIDPSTGTVAASCGVIVTAGRARFQSVGTALEFRRRGICSRLVIEAARKSARAYGAERFVIVADPDYHALGLYESLGFLLAERVAGVCRWPRAAA